MEGYKAVLTRYFSLWVAYYDRFYRLIEQSGFIASFESTRPLDITVYIETIIIANANHFKELETLYIEMLEKFGYSKSAYRFLKEKFQYKVKSYAKFFNKSLIQKISNKHQQNAFIDHHKDNLLELLVNQEKRIKDTFKKIQI